MRYDIYIYIYIYTHTHIYIYIYVIRQLKVKLAGTSVQSTAGSRGVRISLSNAGYTTFGGDVRVLATHSIRQFPLHFPSRASPVPPGSERALAPFERGIIAMVVLTLSLQIHE